MKWKQKLFEDERRNFLKGNFFSNEHKYQQIKNIFRIFTDKMQLFLYFYDSTNEFDDEKLEKFDTR